MLKKELFDPSLVNVIEMTFWFVRFVEYYESFYGEALEATSKTEKSKEEKSSMIGRTTSGLIKFSRYMIKYVTSFDKLFKIAQKALNK